MQLGPEGRMYIIRESIMPMLQLTQDEKPIVWRPFKCPRGQALEGLGKRTLGSRLRDFSGSSVATVKRFVEDEKPQEEPVDEATIASHKLVLWTPPADDPEHRKDVIVDFDVSCKLREHQRIGVQFLFDCLMGLKDFNGCGCILADDMGLGKTLQSVVAIWTLLTQGGPYGRGCCRKALVLCPASLVKNWAGELDKWLHGKCKYHACAVTGQAQVSGTFGSFKYDRESRVLIASYETFRNHAREVEDAGIDLVVCDEAHKLKNDEAATTKCISALPAKRRLLISGTPIQNSLEEFFTLVSLANPGVFGALHEFRKKFANPILRGREPTASPEERAKAEEMLSEVSHVTDKFILRRTNRLNARFLPPKQIFNVFVMPTDFQRRLYRSFLKSNVARKLLEDQNCKMTRSVLSTIKKLQGLVNHPFLVRSREQKLEAGFDDDETRAMFEEIDRMDRGLRGAKPVREELSGKLALVHQILSAIKASGNGDRIVLISNWTQTLDLIERLCAQCNWPTHRLDGTMAITKRMKLVTDFNRPENEQAFAFLLSSKAGGCGLNLIGANRLVMFDPDWNPANDRQAMARVWRDGQKKPCYIYRLFTTGTIDEKVYQRQICKDGLSNMMVTETGEDEAQMTESLASDLVKDLFTFSERTACATHDMLSCERCGSNGPAVPQEDEVLEDDLGTWSHHPGTEGVKDDILQAAAKELLKLRTWTRGSASANVALGGVSFTMGCHIEYTKEQIAKLEAEEKAEQERRKAKVSEESVSKAAVQAAASPAKASKASSSTSRSNETSAVSLQASGSKISSRPKEVLKVSETVVSPPAEAVPSLRIQGKSAPGEAATAAPRMSAPSAALAVAKAARAELEKGKQAAVPSAKGVEANKTPPVIQVGDEDRPVKRLRIASEEGQPVRRSKRLANR